VREGPAHAYAKLRRRKRSGRDHANGIASADAVQTELDPPVDRIKVFSKR